MAHWHYIELGGSSAQTAIGDAASVFQFVPGLMHSPSTPVALACPGLIRGRQVWYASNLGWPDVADPARELGIADLRILINDAQAAALGEACLRAGGNPSQNLLYIALGTGVGSALVVNQHAYDYDLGHAQIGGTRYCGGCRSTGCLNSELEARALPPELTAEHQAFVAQTLARALAQKPVAADVSIVLGGGIVRRYPGVVARLAVLTSCHVEETAAPPEAKSAAYAGLAYLARQMEDASQRNQL